MKTVTTNTLNEIKNSYDVLTSVRVIAEWNQNRYATITSVTNGLPSSAVEDGDPDMFPIESIVLPDRPVAGIVKNRANSQRRADFQPDGYVTKGYLHKPNGPRYVTSTPDAKYQYWSSPGESTGTFVGSTASNISNVQPTIMYGGPTWTNKIVVQIENSYAQPSLWNIQITTDGTNWTTISTNATIPSNGRVEIYRQANSTWGTTAYYDNPVQIRGLRMNVTQMNRTKVFFNLIELGARIESDLSPYVIDYESSFEMSDTSFITPLGVASGNTGSVTLSNFDNRFSNDNPSSLYYGIIDKNVQMRVDLGVSTDPYQTTNKTYEWIRQMTMRVDEWSGQDLDTMTANLQDDSMYLQSVKPNAVVYQSMTVAEIVWRLLDSIGYTNYFVEVIDADPTTLIPYFWCDGEDTIWDIFKKLAQATQTAIYFDEYGTLQIKTRNVAFKAGQTPVWTFDQSQNGSKLPDIISLNKTRNYEANVVNVAYREVKPSEEKNGTYAMQTVWEPEGSVVMRATPLIHPMTSNQNYLRLTPSAAAIWPYEGIMQIQGEYIRYSGKGYSYYDAGGVLRNKYIKSTDEKVALDRLNAYFSYKNSFNGYFWITERGALNSSPKTHTIDASGYFSRIRTGNQAVKNWTGGWKALPGTSVAKITTNSTFKTNSWYTVTRGSEFDVAPNYFGARVRFPTSGYTWGAGGLTFGNTTNESGYFLELFNTNLYTAHPTARNTTNEIGFYVKNSAGTVSRFGPNNKKGTVVAIQKGVWYDIDVSANWNASGGPIFSIYINGVFQYTVQVPTASKPSGTPSGRWGVYTRGFTNMEVEYVYASNSSEAVPFDESSRYSRIHGGYESTQLFNEWVYNIRKVWRTIGKRRTSVIQRYNQLFVDDFGPVAHEVREFDVKFDVESKGPSLHSRLYFSNTSQVVCLDYNADPFGAKFLLASASRKTAVINGEDNVSFGPNNQVTQKMLVYGRTLLNTDEKTKTTKNEYAIRRRGEVAVDFPSDWIQSEAEATELGKWITMHWAGGQDEIEIESFMNPLLQLGDVVAVNFPPGNMTAATHKYFVVKASHSYDQGLGSKFTLRRARI